MKSDGLETDEKILSFYCQFKFDQGCTLLTRTYRTRIVSILSSRLRGRRQPRGLGPEDLAQESLIACHRYLIRKTKSGEKIISLPAIIHLHLRGVLKDRRRPRKDALDEAKPQEKSELNVDSTYSNTGSNFQVRVLRDENSEGAQLCIKFDVGSGLDPFKLRHRISQALKDCIISMTNERHKNAFQLKLLGYDDQEIANLLCYKSRNGASGAIRYGKLAIYTCMEQKMKPLCVYEMGRIAK